MTDKVGHFSAGKCGCQLRRIAFVAGLFKHDLDARVRFLEFGNLEFVSSELAG